MLKLSNISKHFGGVRALSDVSLEVDAGEIHALLGENGAGKSTLMKVISGAIQPDGGELIFDGNSIANNNPHLSKMLGIGIIYQEFSLVPALSVSENIALGRTSEAGWLNRKELDQSARKLIQSIGFEMDVRQKVESLPVAQQQVVEIAKALAHKVKLLILDEPSAVLGTQDVKKLFALLKQLRERGVAIIYISHHLDELLQLSDRITVLKDGRTVSTVSTAAMNKDLLVNLMVGRDLSTMYPEKPGVLSAESKITIENLVVRQGKKPLNMELVPGEILGIGGLVGAGRTEVLESLFGRFGTKAAQVRMDGRHLKLTSPGAMIRQGWGMLTEDRKKHGGLLDLSIRDNMVLANLAAVTNRWGFIQRKKETNLVNDLISRLRIKVGHPNDPLSSLSGGNQQKVILAKWLNLDLKVLLIDEPTRGVDVGARAEIYQIIQDLANAGVYIVMVSSDMDELMGLSDRILVLKDGQLQGELLREDFTEERILRLAIGAN